MKAAIYIETSGCAFNAADGEALAGVLRESGHAIAPTAEAADLVLLNTCTVKDRTFLDFEKRLAELRRGPRAKPVVVAGCIPKAYEKTPLLAGVPTLGPDSIRRAPEVVEAAMRGRALARLGREPAAGRAGLAKIRRNPSVEILPIARGCRSSCAFCQTRLARGRLASFPMEEILAQARRAVAEGVSQIWITGQDTGAYGHDIGASLPELLRALLRIPGRFRIRLGMTSPRWAAERLEEYLEIFESPRMFKFFHVPVQSGSERVLARMRRDGTRAEFERVHAAFSARFPEATFMTDIIAGYPEETEADFEETLAMLARMRLPAVNGSRFSPRPGTAAARLPQLPPGVAAERTGRLMGLVRALAGEYHRARIGTRCRALVETRDRAGSIARTDAYRPVRIEAPLAPGAELEVRIVGAREFCFRGEPAEAALSAQIP